MREALVNTLVHGDYSDRASILVVKQPSGFVFRNPGLSRVPVEIALQGGESDCRNRTMQQMFLMVGLGERAGWGLAKIKYGGQRGGRTVELVDSCEPSDQTRLTMRWSESSKPAKAVKKTSEKILAAIKKNSAITVAELADSIGVTARSIERNLQALQRDGRIQRSGPDRGGRWQLL